MECPEKTYNEVKLVPQAKEKTKQKPNNNNNNTPPPKKKKNQEKTPDGRKSHLFSVLSIGCNMTALSRGGKWLVRRKPTTTSS